MRIGEPPLRRARGLASVMLLLWIAAMGAVTAHALQQGSALSRRQAERELLAIGAEFEAALRSHGGPPATLEELLRDPRSPVVRRHLRRLYADPLTGRREWGLLTDAQGRIAGVFSLAPGEPLQRGGFPPGRAHFANAERYRDWVFGSMLPPGTARTTTTARRDQPLNP